MVDRLHIAVGILVDAGGRRVLIAQRPQGALHEGLWEFPGGKQADGESVFAALQRELSEELGIAVDCAEPVMTVDHDYAERAVRLHVWMVLAWRGTARGNEGQPVQWVPLEQLHSFVFPEADRPIINRLCLPPLQAVTPDLPAYGEEFFAALETVLAAGLRLLQFRSRVLPPHARVEVVGRLRHACARRHCLLMLNGTPDEAMQLDVDGVHLNSANLLRTDQRPDPRLLLGASCHNAAELRRARLLNADYAVLGPIRYSRSHDAAKPLGWEEFSQLAALSGLPCYALGGLEADDLRDALQSGAHGIAMISGVWDAPDRAAAVRACGPRPLSAG